MNSKLRCKVCREYHPREQVKFGFCSDECASAYRQRQQSKPKKISQPKPPSRRRTFTPELKQQVRERDGNRCRWCLKSGMPLECHHIILRSQGGAELDAPWNLISLCQDCHRRAHSNVPFWQGILLYAVNFTSVAVPQAKRMFEAQGGVLPSGPYDFHPSARRYLLSEEEGSVRN